MGTAATLVVALGLLGIDLTVHIVLIRSFKALCRTAATEWRGDEIHIEVEYRRLRLHASTKTSNQSLPQEPGVKLPKKRKGRRG
jgi:hypothetical protein